jgi:hypothetical protein
MCLVELPSPTVAASLSSSPLLGEFGLEPAELSPRHEALALSELARDAGLLHADFPAAE